MRHHQGTLAEEGFEQYRKPTRREQFLDDMDRIVPWKDLCGVIEPFDPKGKGAGRPPIDVERMLRIHFVQHWFNLSDPAVEEALYDSRSMRRFVHVMAVGHSTRCRSPSPSDRGQSRSVATQDVQHFSRQCRIRLS